MHANISFKHTSCSAIWLHPHHAWDLLLNHGRAGPEHPAPGILSWVVRSVTAKHSPAVARGVGRGSDLTLPRLTHTSATGDARYAAELPIGTHMSDGKRPIVIHSRQQADMSESAAQRLRGSHSVMIKRHAAPSVQRCLTPSPPIFAGPPPSMKSLSTLVRLAPYFPVSNLTSLSL